MWAGPLFRRSPFYSSRKQTTSASLSFSKSRNCTAPYGPYLSWKINCFIGLQLCPICPKDILPEVLWFVRTCISANSRMAFMFQLSHHWNPVLLSDTVGSPPTPLSLSWSDPVSVGHTVTSNSHVRTSLYFTLTFITFLGVPTKRHLSNSDDSLLVWLIY